jgi:hypothetical protein
MQKQPARGRSPGGRGSARWLVLPLALGCGKSGEPDVWLGTQECSVGIPPEQTPDAAFSPVSIPLSKTEFVLTGNGFYLQDFTIGPIGDFACEALPFQVTAHFTDKDAVQVPEARPVLARPIALDPFQCRALDGRFYTLTGSGQLDQRDAFINQTFSAWFVAGQSTLVCTTRFHLQVSGADAGVQPVPVEELPPFGMDPDPGAEAEPAPPEMAPDQPDAGAAEAPDMGAAG